MTRSWSGRRLLVVVAHPDDETFGLGSLIAGAAGAGARVTVCCATRGEAGEVAAGCEVAVGDLGAVRVRELHDAGAALGVSEIVMLDFGDSGMVGDTEDTTLVGAPLASVVDAVAAVVSRVSPDVVVTLDPTGGDGHRDHVRIAEATVAAARTSAPGSSIYCGTVTRSLMQRWLEGQQQAHPDAGHLGLERTELGRPDDEVTTVVDLGAHLDVRRRAIALHHSQRSPFEGMPADLVDTFLRYGYLVRVEPPWAGGPLETTLLVPDRPA